MVYISNVEDCILMACERGGNGSDYSLARWVKKLMQFSGRRLFFSYTRSKNFLPVSLEMLCFKKA
jgi:hypothetical protein